jgi:glycosyltransferase involved in cell wall biosynthesis
MIEASEPDSIHIAVEGPLGRAARSICLKENRPFSTCYHSHFPDYIAKRLEWLGKGISQYFKQKTISYLRRFHAPSKHIFVATESLEQTLRSWGFKNKMVRLVRGVETGLFKPQDNAPTQANTIRLIYVGRVSTEKNLEAFFRLKHDDYTLEKTVIGGGPSLESFKKRWPEIQFKGYLQGEDLANAYARNDIFVFPSKTDTFGLVLIEALSCGLPVAAYNVTGPKDILTSPLLGFAEESLKVALDKTIQTLPQYTAKQRHEHIKSHYSWPQVTKTFIQHCFTEPPSHQEQDEQFNKAA